jgi:hypothetical protein
MFIKDGWRKEGGVKTGRAWHSGAFDGIFFDGDDVRTVDVKGTRRLKGSNGIIPDMVETEDGLVIGLTGTSQKVLEVIGVVGGLNVAWIK